MSIWKQQDFFVTTGHFLQIKSFVAKDIFKDEGCFIKKEKKIY